MAETNTSQVPARVLANATKERSGDQVGQELAALPPLATVRERPDKAAGVSVTMELAAKARALKAQGRDVISLTAGEPDMDTPGPIMDAGDAFNNEHVRARGTLVPMKHPDIPGEHLFPGPLWKWSDAPVTIRKAPVTLGEDNDYVYRTVLGKDDAAMAALAAEGHLADGYRDAEGRPL